MGFGESLSKVYVSIQEGKLAVRSNESDPKAVKRELKTGHVIYERRYGSLTGRLKEIGFRKVEYNGSKWEEMYLLIFDGQDHYQIQMPFPSNYSNSFLRAIKNVDLTKELTLNPWRKVTPEKTRTALYINQGGNTVQWYYGGTPETANGLPDLVPYKIPGEEEQKWSDVERNKFLQDMVRNEIAPKLVAAWGGAMPAESFKPQDIPDAASITEPIDDLPF